MPQIDLTTNDNSVGETPIESPLNRLLDILQTSRGAKP